MNPQQLTSTIDQVLAAPETNTHNKATKHNRGSVHTEYKTRHPPATLLVSTKT